MKLSQVTRFDGSKTEKRNIKKGEVSFEFEGYTFDNVPVMEWPMGNTHDIILGKPWFTNYQPIINWRTHQVQVPVFKEVNATAEEISEVNSRTFQQNMKQQAYEKVYRVKVCSVREDKKIPEPIQDLLEKYSDVFPEALLDGLPPSRRVEFELNMKKDATPSHRAPFRLSKTEQDALELFVKEKLKKGWIELSDSPWVSNIFGIPKKDPESGKQYSRSEWVRSGNATLPIRWVIDFRYINSQTNVPKITLPRIEELFDKMVGCEIYSVLDLAQGYHQMRISKDSRKYTAFRTHSETYQWCVAPMGLAGMPGVWSRLMRVLFGKFPFLVVYLDDICVFSHNMQEHLEHLESLFHELREAKLYAHAKKCHFGQSKSNFWVIQYHNKVSQWTNPRLKL